MPSWSGGRGLLSLCRDRQPALAAASAVQPRQSQWSLQRPMKHGVKSQAFFGLSVSSGYAVAVPLGHTLAALQGAGDGWPLDVAFLS